MHYKEIEFIDLNGERQSTGTFIKRRRRWYSLDWAQLGWDFDWVALLIVAPLFAIGLAVITGLYGA